MKTGSFTSNNTTMAVQMQSSKAMMLKRYYPSWVVILMSSFFLFYKYVLQVSPSIMTNELMRHFHIHGVGLGNLAATFFYSYLVTQFFDGPLLDKYNPRLLTTFALAVSAMGALVFVCAPSLMVTVLGRGLVGIGAAFATVSYMKMAAVWFQAKQFAFVSGLLVTAAMLGSMASQVSWTLLVSQVGWQASLYYCGLLGLVLASLYYMLVRNHSGFHSATVETLKTNALSFRDIATLLKQKHNWMLMLYSGLAFAPLAVLGGLWGNPFFQEAHRLTKPEAVSLTSLMFFGLSVGGPL